MRELKHRAWHYMDKQMIPVCIIDGKPGIYDEVGRCGLLYVEGIVSEPMDYTGLKDNNGKEIYEGDIVNFTYWWFDGNVAESNLCGEVVYLEGCMSFGLKHVKNSDWCKYTGADRKIGDTDHFGQWLFDEADFEVIGNIYEHPHLLMTKEEIAREMTGCG